MFKILGKIPKQHFHVACSGGPDSMVLIDYLSRWPKNSFDVLHFNHGSSCCHEAEDFISDFCQKRGLELHIGKIKDARKPKSKSQEEFWRENRYGFFNEWKSEPILMAHHLNDVIETWMMGCAIGNPRLIPYHNGMYNIYRPFLCVSKSEINEWIVKNKVDHVIDKSNYDTRMLRNYIRHKMMPDIYHINPGIEKTITKLILKDYKKEFIHE